METEPGKAYSILKRLGAKPGESGNMGSFTIPEHVSLGLSAQQSADRIATKFAEISQEYEALDMGSLPTRVPGIQKEESLGTSQSNYEKNLDPNWPSQQLRFYQHC